MRKMILAAVTLAAIGSVAAARADEFGGQQQSQQGVNAYLDQQATNAELADPTAPNSLRSHGRP